MFCQWRARAVAAPSWRASSTDAGEPPKPTRLSSSRAAARSPVARWRRSQPPATQPATTAVTSRSRSGPARSTAIRRWP
ncbi:MAG: hypothetical protein E6J41_03510 [Chloroflexi bacterium]|nr:MAG: hypothetical protein E6J41_03510 [Chloroflexota bacterium]